MTDVVVTVVPEGGRKVVDVVRLDAAWNAAISDPVAAGDRVVIDLSNAGFVAQECLLYLLGLLDQLASASVDFSIALPTSTTVLEFIRAWNFPEAVLSVTGRPFTEILVEESSKRFEAVTDDPPKYLRIETLPDGGRESLLPQGFFAITPIGLKGTAVDAASMIRSQWLNDHIVGVLDEHLGGYGDRVASHIMYEGVLNAVSHPHATLAFTSSQVERQGHRRVLTLSIWDDGSNFTDTLVNAFRAHGTVQSPAFGLVDETFDLTYIDRIVGRSEQQTISSRDEVSMESVEHVLLAAFFLGITSSPTYVKGPGGQEVPESVPADWLPAEARPYGGLGLHLIRKTVIDQFSGELFYASGPFRLNLACAQPARPGFYAARMSRLRPSDVQIRGNLLVAHIPLSEA